MYFWVKQFPWSLTSVFFEEVKNNMKQTISKHLGLSRYQNFSIRYQYQWKSTVLGTNFGTKAKHKNMLIKKHIFINKVKQK